MNTKNNRPSILFVTDLYYQAQSREYYQEDLFLTGQLQHDFDVLICHPLHTGPFEKLVDLIIIRNSGPVINYKEAYDCFVERVTKEKILTYNSMTGNGDMAGKEYLLTLTKEGYPVIPTVDRIEDVHRLPACERYIVKPKLGADSIGLQKVGAQELSSIHKDGMLVQPFIDFQYEVSFYFIDNDLQYALYAPDKSRRWQLERFEPTAEDIAFAQRFIQWNTITHGIQRVDACRTAAGQLLLVELEDLNPFLSLDLLDEDTRQKFVKRFMQSIQQTMEEHTL